MMREKAINFNRVADQAAGKRPKRRHPVWTPGLRPRTREAEGDAPQATWLLRIAAIEWLPARATAAIVQTVTAPVGQSARAEMSIPRK